MGLDLKVAADRPSNWPTVPRMDAAEAHVRRLGSSPWLERLRAESGYVAVTVGLDVWSTSLSVAVAHWWTPGPLQERNVGLYSWMFVPIVLVVLATRFMYRRRLSQGFVDEFEPLQTSVAVSTLTTLTFMVLLVPSQLPGELVVPFVRPSEVMVRVWVSAAILVPAVRLARSMVERYLRREFRFGAPALIIGSGPVAHQLISRMRQVPEYGLRPVGVLDDVRPPAEELLGVPYMGTTSNLEHVARATGAAKLIIAQSSTADERLVQSAQLAQRLGMRVRVVPRLMDAVSTGARVEHLGGIPLLVLDHVNPKGWQFRIKHTADRVLAGVGLVLISPLMIILALLVKRSSPGPVLFRQKRIGRDGIVFDCLKFRTMRLTDPGDDGGFRAKVGFAPGGVEGDDRRTWIGKFLRRTSLDELPQLLNVLRGEMSLVGPRPERPEFVELFAIQVRRYGQRHRVKAGMTGWAQVHGLRGQTSIAERAEFDNFYIQNWSLLLDLKVLALTTLAVLRNPEA